jgi:proline iminopeptidase
MEALRQYLGLERIGVLGASYGGVVALSYAVRYPQYVSHLIAVATVPSFHFLARARHILAERGTPEQQEIAERLWSGTFESDEQLRDYFDMLGPLYALTYNPQKSRERRRRAILSHEAMNVGFGTFLRTFDITDQLQNITAPTLVIAGRHDWICPPEFSEIIARRIPGADLRIFEQSAHSILADEPQAFIDVVRGFLTYQRPTTQRETPDR